MWRVIDGIRYEHDHRFVALAVVLCSLGSIATHLVAQRTIQTTRFVPWIMLLSICGGAMLWSTHFVSVLAFQLRIPMTYEPVLTGLSFLVCVIGMGLGCTLAIKGKHPQRDPWLGGVIVGIGVAVLHYVGMAALRFPGHISYETSLVLASVIFAGGFGAATTRVLFGKPVKQARLLGIALLVLMTATLHYTGMGAANLNLGTALVDDVQGLSRAALATEVTIAFLVILGAGLAGALFDERISRQFIAEAERFRAFANGTFEGLVVHRDGVVVDTNRSARTMLGMGTETGPQTLAELIGEGSWNELQGTRSDGDDDAAEIELMRTDGEVFTTEVRRRSILLPDGREGEMIAIRDISARKESEAQIAHLALHDVLTDLPNRRFFNERTKKSIGRSHRQNDPFALMVMDLDDFKSVNDMYGHDAGDELLRTVAQRIRSTLRDGDIVARIGGDEFALLEHSTKQPADAMLLAERVLRTLNEPVSSNRTSFYGRASIGIALYPTDGTTLETLLRNADTAIYRAKADGKSTCRFFEPHMDEALANRRRLEHRLRMAVEAEALQVFYQLIIDAESLRPLGFEALLRWHDKELGPVSPGEFVPVAEATGLIVPIGEQVLRRACKDAAAWPDNLKVAVNLSPVQFRREGLVGVVREALADAGIEGSRLVLEVTESLLIDNTNDVNRILTSINGQDVAVAMDDFGTGYSSLGYLQSFPFDKLKIDRVFVADVQNNARNAGIIRAVIAMGKSLGMRVVAEGVETEEQLSILRDLDCDELQGFFIAKRMPVDQISDYLLSASQLAISPSALATGA
jgi:diguanylate cyclase (GGDEF)-like protein/PAS domain S-box-containing protein